MLSYKKKNSWKFGIAVKIGSKKKVAEQIQNDQTHLSW